MNRPRPVLTAAGISGGITSIAGVLAFLGYNDASAHLSASTTTITAVIIGAVTLASHILAAVHAQSKVTPMASPVDASGTPLVPITSPAAGGPIILTEDPTPSASDTLIGR